MDWAIQILIKRLQNTVHRIYVYDILEHLYIYISPLNPFPLSLPSAAFGSAYRLSMPIVAERGGRTGRKSKGCIPCTNGREGERREGGRERERERRCGQPPSLSRVSVRSEMDS